MSGTIHVDRARLQPPAVEREAWIFTGKVHRARWLPQYLRWVLACSGRAVSPAEPLTEERVQELAAFMCSKCGNDLERNGS